jgi:hypothetical protein
VRRSLSVLVHADTKVGKSTFANTAPAPRLLLDAEAAHRFLPGVKTYWDPFTQGPPTLGVGRPNDVKDEEVPLEWETCVVVVREWSVVPRVYEWLNSGQHPFLSLIIDSISEIQTKARDSISATGQMQIQQWGELLVIMERYVRNLRDLTEHPVKPLQSIILTAMTQMSDGKYRPYVQGQLKVKLPYFLDVIGYLYVQDVPNEADPTKPGTKMRRMLVVPHVQFEAGERVQGRLGDVVDNPTVVGMLDSVFGAETPVAAVQESEPTA